MRIRFRPDRGAVVVPLFLEGPNGRRVRVRAALDTGALHSLLIPSVLADCGIDVGAGQAFPIATVGGASTARAVTVSAFEALGIRRRGCTVVAHPLSRDIGVEALIGLDHLRGRTVHLDFAHGVLEVT